MNDELKKEIELEVRRISKENEDSFRTFIEKSIKHFIWIISTLAVLILGGLYYFFGNTSEKLNNKITQGVEQIVIENEINSKIADKIDVNLNRITRAKEKELYENLSRIENIIQDSIEYMINDKIPDIEARVQQIIDQFQGDELQVIFKTKLDQIKNINQIPSGTIIAWNGVNKKVPFGWRICDGNNQTPDLRNRFILGGNKSEIGEKGGTSDHTHSFTLEVSPLKEDFKYIESKEHAFKTPEREKTKENPIVVETNKSANIPPYYKLVYLIKI